MITPAAKIVKHIPLGKKIERYERTSDIDFYVTLSSLLSNEG